MNAFKRLPIAAVPGLLAGFLGFSCSTKKVNIPVTPVAPIASYCPHLPSRTFPSPVTISGVAQYQFRNNGNGTVNGTPNPVRHAEVEVLDAAGGIVQCAETDGSGAFSFQLPAGTGDYTVKVNARANNANVKAYVMNNPTDNSYHSISTSVGTAESASLTMTAPATGSVVAGAFNILDKILDANVFLRAHASAAECAAFAGCPTFTVAPLAYVYWTAGFNPNAYLGGGAGGVSFFLKGTNELYILGGIAGDVDSSDCDHFDNSIILHEYGHFIEASYSASDSPGGRHAPNEVIDPRLAWSEGFANFFQAAVTGKAVYRDTEGNVSCGTGCTQAFHDEDLETVEAYDDPATMAAGEGNFREFAISRLLWDAIDPHPVSGEGGAGDPRNDLAFETVQSPFAEVWTVFTGAVTGFKSASARFRSSGLFLSFQRAVAGGQDWATIRAREGLSGDQRDFATPVAVPGACGPQTLQVNGGTNGSFEASNLFYDNDFHAHYHASGPLTVRVEYSQLGGTPADIDLIVWKNGFTYGKLGDALATSRRSRSTDGSTEQISVTAPAGWYMINVMGLPHSTGAGGTAMSYDLYINGQKACPDP